MNWEGFGEPWIRVAEITTFRYFLIAGLVFFTFYFLLKNVLASCRIQDKFPGMKDYSKNLLHSLIPTLYFSLDGD